MAKPNYEFEKRRRELEKKKKMEEKRQRKLEKRGDAAADPSEPQPDAAVAVAQAPGTPAPEGSNKG